MYFIAPCLCTPPPSFSRAAYSSSLKMETAGPTKPLLPVYQNTRHHIPQDSSLHINNSENVKLHEANRVKGEEVGYVMSRGFTAHGRNFDITFGGRGLRLKHAVQRAL
jgi:hypothetical protein